MYIQSLTLKNWGPYYGSHHLDLESKVYAVQAAGEDEPERSNWFGKSWFLGAIRFLLTGVEPESCPNADGWISWGEKTGSVEGVLSDGTTIKRSRNLGKSTQLELTIPGKALAKQERGQAELFAHMGMSAEDLLATSFIEQRQIARLVLEDPAERTRIVNGWMELEPLQIAEEWAKDQLTKLLDEERKLGEPVQGPTETREQLDVTIERVENWIVQLKEDREEVRKQQSDLGEWRRHNTRLARWELVKARGIALKRQLELAPSLADHTTLQDNRDQLALDQQQAVDKQQGLQQLVDNEWDGVCPKTCQQCPVGDHVREVGLMMAEQLEQAQDSVRDIGIRFQQARTKAVQAAEQHRVQLSQEQELERLRDEGVELLESVDFIEANGLPPEDDQELVRKLNMLDEHYEQATRELADAEAKLDLLDKVEKVAASSKERRAALERAICTHREAIAVVGRQGAQREVAEGVLSEIESGANLLLAGASIDLTVEVSWAREGKGLATHCEACGAGFPKSLAQKVCTICGAQRGPKMVEKLKIEPNDRSGAADDIAGLSFQLSASSWLRTKRGAPWAVACIDEPFGQMDRYNARAISSRLHAMIRGSYLFEQAFIVAHDSSIMEALPARVQITGTSSGSKVVVS